MPGVGQQSVAVQHLVGKHDSKSLGHTKSIKRKRKKAKSAAPKRRRAKKSSPLVAGSAAAKAWGAKMRKARKKKG
jgi:hypothetical protein